MKMVIKKKKNKHIILNLIVIIIIGIFCSFILIRFFSKKVSPIFMNYAEDEIRKLASLVINDSINYMKLFDDVDDESLFEIVKNNNGDIQLITYNTKNVNLLLDKITNLIQNNLKAIENGTLNDIDLPDSSLSRYDKNLLNEGIIYEIPFGIITGSSLLSNVGPMIPVKFSLVGDVISNINTKVTEYGINNAMMEVGVNITITARVNLPFVSNRVTLSNTIPISMKIIQGNIPNFYSGILQSSFGYVYSYDNI